MAYGFEVRNNNNQVLVSSDAKCLHFVQKAVFSSIIFQLAPTDWTGVVYPNAPTGWAGGCTIFRFVCFCNTLPVPFFTMPNWQFSGIIGVTNVVGNEWNIDIAVSGPTVGILTPEVYIFAEAAGYTFPITETHGMQVLASDGSICFDSRLNPLLIEGGISVAPPLSPVKVFDTSTYPVGRLWLESAQSQTNDIQKIGERFTADNFTEVMYPANFGPTKPIYNYYSVANAEKEAYGYLTYSVPVGFFGWSHDVYEVMVWFWGFYRSGIQNTGVSLLAGWITTDHGARYRWTRNNSGSWVDAITGGGGGSSSGTGGTTPMINTAKNLNPQLVMISDGALYD